MSKQQYQNHVTDSHVQFISDNIAVIFKKTEHSGMVGETHEDFTAHMINLETQKMTVLKYEQIKTFYKYISSRQERIDYWRWMNCFTSEAELKRMMQSTAEALSIVR